MEFHFTQLHDETRKEMMKEVERDITNDKVYMSKRFTPKGEEIYIKLLKEAIQEGDDQTLKHELIAQGCISEYAMTKKGTHMKVPSNSARMFARGEFNHYYMRAICKLADKQGKVVKIYRAKDTEHPRPESKKLIGNVYDPQFLLDQLRNNRFDINPPIGKAFSGLSLEFA